MELALIHDAQREQTKRLASLLKDVAQKAWPGCSSDIELLHMAPEWENIRWSVAYWQAPEQHRMAIMVPEDAIQQLNQESVPGFEQATPMLQWEEPFLESSELLWQQKIRWELADLEISHDPEGWLAQHGLTETVVVYVMSAPQSGDRAEKIYFVLPHDELVSLSQGQRQHSTDNNGRSQNGKQNSVSSHTFAPISSELNQNAETRNIDLIMDVPLNLTVELGRTVRTIREVLSMGPGSLIELDRMAGETVDVLVNNRLVAKGEVVVIDENFGIRITDIVSPTERLQKLS